MSFSGLKTALRVFCEKNPEILENKNSQDFFDLCASYQSAISKALLLKCRYAFEKIKEFGVNPKEIDLVIGGGVACNSMIRADFKQKYPKTKVVTPEYCTDNGAMIAHLGLLQIEKAQPFPQCLDLDARGRFIEKGQ